eukprot:scaffold28288_cov127-Isochrysis_galbana.AAC.1
MASTLPGRIWRAAAHRRAVDARASVSPTPVAAGLARAAMRVAVSRSGQTMSASRVRRRRLATRDESTVCITGSIESSGGDGREAQRSAASISPAPPPSTSTCSASMSVPSSGGTHAHSLSQPSQPTGSQLIRSPSYAMRSPGVVDTPSSRCTSGVIPRTRSSPNRPSSRSRPAGATRRQWMDGSARRTPTAACTPPPPSRRLPPSTTSRIILETTHTFRPATTGASNSRSPEVDGIASGQHRGNQQPSNQVHFHTAGGTAKQYREGAVCFRPLPRVHSQAWRHNTNKNNQEYFNQERPHD